MWVLLIPIILQGTAIFFDEFFFHQKRGLPPWEKWGHPLDTFFVLVCYLFLIFNKPDSENLNIYIGLCIFSCLFITKDEFVHTQYCEAAENWLHSILFILHPITFFVAGIIWQEQKDLFFLQAQAFI